MMIAAKRERRGRGQHGEVEGAEREDDVPAGPIGCADVFHIVGPFILDVWRPMFVMSICLWFGRPLPALLVTTGKLLEPYRPARLGRNPVSFEQEYPLIDPRGGRIPG
jgi:hypothetical protein